MNRKRKDNQYTEGFDAGFEAANQGSDVSDNPFGRGDINRYDGWMAGWYFYMDDGSDNSEEG